MAHTLFIFFRDFRIQDNVGLNEVMKSRTNVIPIFIFVDEQINPRKNKYFSHNCVQFLCESLEDLNANLKKKGRELYIFKANDIVSALNSICSQIDVECIAYNQDYTPYSRKREIILEKWCKQKEIIHEKYEDYLLAPMGTFLKHTGEVYSVYTPFRNNAMKDLTKIPKPSRANTKNIALCDDLKHNKHFMHIDDLSRLYIRNPLKLVDGGRQRGLNLLLRTRKIPYDLKRDQLMFSTSRLSAYIKFGNISIREAFWKFHNDKQEGKSTKEGRIDYSNVKLVEKAAKAKTKKKKASSGAKA